MGAAAETADDRQQDEGGLGTRLEERAEHG
jgi:hypothetical protein